MQKQFLQLIKERLAKKDAVLEGHNQVPNHLVGRYIDSLEKDIELFMKALLSFEDTPLVQESSTKPAFTQIEEPIVVKVSESEILDEFAKRSSYFKDFSRTVEATPSDPLEDEIPSSDPEERKFWKSYIFPLMKKLNQVNVKWRVHSTKPRALTVDDTWLITFGPYIVTIRNIYYQSEEVKYEPDANHMAQTIVNILLEGF